MDRETRRRLVKTLVQAGRRDLAREVVAGRMKPAHLLRMEEALTKTVFDTMKKLKYKLHPRAPQQFNYLVKKWVDAVETMID